MRITRRGYLLTALPFMVIMAARDVTISTRVESDGAGLRQVKVLADRDRKPDISDKRVDELLPQIQGRRSKASLSGDSYRVSGDVRFVDTHAFGDLEITRRTRVRLWPPFSTTYSYSDKLSRTDFAGTDRELAAAPETKFEYSVTLPGTIDEASPPSGRIEGRTVTWTLKADKETQDVTVTSTQIEWLPTAFLALLLVIVLFTALRFVQHRRRTKPQHI